MSLLETYPPGSELPKPRSNGHRQRPDVIDELDPEVALALRIPEGTEEEARVLDDLETDVDAAMIKKPETEAALTRERSIFATILALTSPLARDVRILPIEEQNQYNFPDEQYHRLSPDSITSRFGDKLPAVA